MGAFGKVLGLLRLLYVFVWMEKEKVSLAGGAGFKNESPKGIVI